MLGFFLSNVSVYLSLFDAMPILFACTSQHECLCVREGEQSIQRKRSYGSPLVSISEGEETDCREGTGPDEAECTTNSPNSAAGSMEVNKIIISET